MKFTNVKQLIIKFMGGGLINFPTRFLRWVKINGDSDDSDDSGSGDGGGSVDINTILDNISIKDDLLTKLQAIDYTNQDPDDGVLTNLTFDDIFNDYDDFIKSWLYREEFPSIAGIQVSPLRMDYLEKGHNIISFRIQDVDYTTYGVGVVNDNNNIKIYVIKETGSGPNQ